MMQAVSSYIAETESRIVQMWKIICLFYELHKRHLSNYWCDIVEFYQKGTRLDENNKKDE
jgi:hypothetical protein